MSKLNIFDGLLTLLLVVSEHILIKVFVKLLFVILYISNFIFEMVGKGHA